MYKKYIIRNGKKFGPYYCESYRDSDGKVKTRFVSGPKKKDVVIKHVKKSVGNLNNKRLILVFALFFVFFVLLLAGNINYNSNLSGRVVDVGISSEDMNIAEDLAEGLIESTEDIRDEVEAIEDINSRIMEFEVPEGTISMEFDLLDYGDWVSNEAENEETIENFDIQVEESAEKYKWGYDVKLTSLDFMARIDVSSDVGIGIVDNQTLKIGDNYLSFADLTEQGYIVRIENPVVLEDVNVTLEEANVSDTNISELNVTLPIEDISEVNVSEVNFTLPVERLEEIDISDTNPSDINVTLPIEDITDIEINETEIIIESPAEELLGLDESEENEIKEPISEIEIELEIIGEEPRGEGSGIGDIAEIDEEILDEIQEELDEVDLTEDVEVVEESQEITIVGGVIRKITGFIVRGFKGMTGNVIGGEKKISVYIQRDFSGANVSVGDIINLDPVLIRVSGAGTAVDGQIVYQCGTITEAGSYVMNQSINTTGTCLIIQANNITIDMQGYNMTGDNNSGQDYGIYSYPGNYDNLTIKNGYIYNFGRSIYSSGDYGDFTNLTIIAEGRFVYPSYGIILSGGYNTLYDINTSISELSSTGPIYGCGIYLSGYSNILSRINSYLNTGVGIFLHYSDNNIISNSSISLNNYSGLFLSYSSNNNFINLNLDSNTLKSGNYGNYFLYLGSNNNTLKDSNISGIFNHVELSQNSIDNIFLNTSYETKIVSDESSLIRKWYYQVYVNDSFGNFVANANMSIYDSNSLMVYNSITNESGWTNITELIEYVNNDDVKTYYLNYTNVAKNSSGWWGYKEYNLTENQNNLKDNIEINNSNHDLSSCGILFLSDTIYTLQNNIYLNDTCFRIVENNISLDMNGFNITGGGTTGCSGFVAEGGGDETCQWGVANIGSYENLTVKNGYIYDYNIGIYNNGDYGNFTNLTIISNISLDFAEYFGIFLKDNRENYIENNYINIVNSQIYGFCVGIYSNNSQNDIFKGNIVTNMSGSRGGVGDGIRLINSNNSIIYNNIFNSNDDKGIYFSSSSNNICYNNSINLNNYGAYFSSSSNNLFYNNTLNLNSFNIRLIHSENNELTANSFRGDSSSNYMFVLSSSDYNLFKSNNMNSGGGYGIFVGGHNNLFRDTNMTNFTSWSIVVGSQKKNNTFINFSYDYLWEHINLGGELIRKWYYRAHVINISSDDVANASIDIYNGIEETPYRQLITNNSGWTNITDIIEYVNTGGTKLFYDNSVIAANDNERLWDDHVYNVSEEQNNFNDSFIVDIDVTSPVLSGASWSLSSPGTIVNNAIAVITWNSDDPSNSSVTYWASPANTVGDNVMKVNNHSITLTSLINNTFYNYYYTSCDFAGNCNTSVTYSFITPSPGTAETGSSGGGAVCISNIKCGLCNENGTRSCWDDNNCGGSYSDEVCDFSSEGVSEQVNENAGENDFKDNSGIELPTMQRCIPDYQCGDWGMCGAVYNLDEIAENRILLKGQQKRSCVDKNNCEYDIIERRECSTQLPIIVEKVEECFEDYIKIYDSNDVLIARMKLFDEVFDKLDIQMIFDDNAYCPYCFDAIKNFDEDDIDCVNEGDSCGMCVDVPIKKDYKGIFWVIFWIWLFLLIVIGRRWLILGRGEKRRRRKIMRMSKKNL